MARSPLMERAIERYECPVCGSPKTEECLYTDVPEPTYRGGTGYKRFLKNGTPMVQLHYERLRLQQDYETRQWRKTNRALQDARVAASEPPPIPPDLLESLRRFDYQEWRQIRIWLHLHAHILWDP